jgi:tetratricopeptide (TPR) repeat protein
MEDKENNYYSNLNRLIRFFEKTKRGYAFASIQNQGQIKVINEQLLENLDSRNINLSFVYFDLKSELSLINQLKQKITKNTNALVVNNIWELLFFSKDQSQLKDRDIVIELNFARESLFKLNTPILFWATNEVIGIISNRAADLYTQRNINTIYFDSIPEDITPELKLEKYVTSKFRSADDFLSLKLKIKLQKKQLADAESGNYPVSNIANRLVLPLAKDYSKIEFHEEALDLIKKYGKYIKRGLQNILDWAYLLRNAKKYDEAIKIYEEAIDISRQENNRYVEGLSISYLAEACQLTGQLKKSLRYYEMYNAISKELYESNPANEIRLNELAISYEKLGTINQSLGNYERALELFEQYNQLSKRLQESNPRNENFKIALAISYERLGNTYQALGDYNKALQFFNLDIDLAKELYDANPRNEALKNELAILYSKLGNIYHALGDFDKAIQLFNLDIELTKELHKANPKNDALKNNLAVQYFKLGEIYRALKDYDKSLHFFLLNSQLFKELCQTNPKNRSLLEGLAVSFYKLALIYKAKGDDENGLLQFNEWKKIIAQLSRKIPRVLKYREWKKLSY